MKILLLGFLALGSIALVGTLVPFGAISPQAELPDAWREHRIDAKMRRRWDAMEGKAPPSLAALSHWTNTEARTWEDLRGKVVLLDYWATWCGPCLSGVPKLRKLEETYADQGLVVLGVHSSSRFDPDRMQSVAARTGMNYPLAADVRGRLGRGLGVQVLPSYFVVDRGGRLRVAGAHQDHLEDIVRALLKEEADTPLTGAGPDAREAAGGWPPHVLKELHARVDFRGKPAPPLAVGEWLTEEPSLEGKVLLLDFWATWCRPCVQLMPEVDRWQREFSEDLVVVGLSDEDPETVRSFLASRSLSYAMAVDEQARTNRRIGIMGIPHVLVVSSDGIVRWQGWPSDPADQLTTAKLRSIIEQDRVLRGVGGDS